MGVTPADNFERQIEESLANVRQLLVAEYRRHLLDLKAKIQGGEHLLEIKDAESQDLAQVPHLDMPAPRRRRASWRESMVPPPDEFASIERLETPPESVSVVRLVSVKSATVESIEMVTPPKSACVSPPAIANMVRLVTPPDQGSTISPKDESPKSSHTACKLSFLEPAAAKVVRPSVRLAIGGSPGDSMPGWGKRDDPRGPTFSDMGGGAKSNVVGFASSPRSSKSDGDQDCERIDEDEETTGGDANKQLSFLKSKTAKFAGSASGNSLSSPIRSSVRRTSVAQSQFATGDWHPGDRRSGTPGVEDEETEHFSLLGVWSESLTRSFRRRLYSRSGPLNFANNTTRTFMDEGSEGEERLQKLLHSRRWFMVHPSALKNIVWDFFGLILIGYDCFSIPLEVFEIEENAWITFMTWLTRMYWTANMPKTLVTGFLEDNGTIEMRPAKVFWRYFLTWFFLDILVVGCDWAELLMGGIIENDSWRAGRGLRAFRLLRTIRMLRMMKAPEITGFISEHIRSESMLLSAAIAKIIFSMVAVAHVIACLWYLVGKFLSGRSTSWLYANDVEDMGVGGRYAISFHWSLSQIAGENLIDPGNVGERVFTVVVLFCAIIASASFVSSLTTSMTQLQIITSTQSTQLSALRRFLADNTISPSLAVRVTRNAQHALKEHKRNMPEGNVDLLRYISNPLLVELHFEIYSHLLMVHPFFYRYNEVNPGGIRRVCHAAVSILHLSAGDVLFSDLEVPTLPRMFFVVGGSLDYKQESEKDQAIGKDSWLCEAVCWTKWTHCGTAVATPETRLLVLEAAGFQDIISTFATDHAANYAIEYVQHLNKAGKHSLTDGPASGAQIREMIDNAFPVDEDSSEEDGSSEDEEEYGGAESDKDASRSHSGSLKPDALAAILPNLATISAAFPSAIGSSRKSSESIDVGDVVTRSASGRANRSSAKTRSSSTCGSSHKKHQKKRHHLRVLESASQMASSIRSRFTRPQVQEMAARIRDSVPRQSTNKVTEVTSGGVR